MESHGCLNMERHGCLNGFPYGCASEILHRVQILLHGRAKIISKFDEFLYPAEVAVVCLKFFLSFIKFCSLVT